ncbi:immunoglobulin domain-containing protein Bsg [Aphomia sociella]
MRLQFCLPLALLFLTIGVPSNAQSEPSASAASAPAAADGVEALVYDVKGLLLLNCTAPGSAASTYKWTKNDTELSEVPELGGPSPRYKLLENGSVFRIEHAHEDDYGNYSCNGREWRVRGRPVARMPLDSNVVEGQKIKIQCRVIGKPYPRVTWTYKNSSDAGVGTELESGDRFRLEASEAGVPDGALVLLEARRSDAGEYWCTPADGTGFGTTLRVKDMYAALWPFLGICAEVFVLCAIILVYEKRRTKPELDDSDTDNHDQKKS